MRRYFRGAILVASLLCVITVSQAGAQGPWDPPVVDEFSINPPDGADLDSGHIKEQAREILSRPEFRRVHVKAPEAIERAEVEPFEWPQWVRDFVEWVRSLFSGVGDFLSPLGLLLRGAPVIAYLLLLAVVVAILYVLYRVVSNFVWRTRISRETLQKIVEEGEAELGPGETPADEYLRRAREFQAAGKFREAIAMLLLGGMSFAERAGWIRHRRGLTHRDYLRAMRGKDLSYAGFKTMVSIFEPICFGRRDAHLEHFETSLESFQQGFSGSNLAMKGA